MAGTFPERIDRLKELVPSGTIRGQVEYDQVYAQVQHEGHWLNYRGWGAPQAGSGPKTIRNHPGGGGSKFLQIPAIGRSDRYLVNLANHVLDDDPGAIVGAMADNMENLCTSASELAPIEFGDLRESDHPTVTVDGGTVYDRPPAVPRLSDGQLDAKAGQRAKGSLRRTYLGDGNPRKGGLHPDNGGEPHPNPDPTTDGRSSKHRAPLHTLIVVRKPVTKPRKTSNTVRRANRNANPTFDDFDYFPDS